MSVVADLTAELVALPSPSGAEGAVLSRCAQVLDSLGLEVSHDRAGNVIATAGDGEPRVLFDAHADTVAPNPGWTRDPYGGERDGGHLYGLGAVDMKGPIAALMLGVGDAVAAGGLAGTVGVSISTLEEVLEGATLAAAVEAFDPTHVVIAEPSDLRLMLGQRGRAEIEIEVTGRGAHAAYPRQGVNALRAAADVLVGLDARPVRHDPRLGDAILVATEAVTTPLPGVSVVPSACRIRLDRRLLLGETEADVLDELQPALAAAAATGARAVARVTSGAVTTHSGAHIDQPRFLPAWLLDRDADLARAARRALAAALGDTEPGAWGFCTNGSLSAGRLGIPTVGFGPGDPERAHTADEHIAVDDLERGRAGFAALAGMEIGVS